MRKNGNTPLFLPFLAILLPVLLYSFFSTSLTAKSATSGSITATVAVGVCGNNIVEYGYYGEQCDGSALDGQTCQSLGYDAGTLACTIGCEFDESDCVFLGPDEGSAVLSGYAYPMSVVKILKDGQIAATTAGGSDASFETTLSNLIVGTYSFAVYAYDSNGNKSKTITYLRDISKDEIEEISNIIVPPTLVANHDEITKGDTITFSGQSAPGAAVIIYLTSGSNVWQLSATAGSNGFYSYQLDTGDYAVGNYTSSAKTTLNALTSDSSDEESFEISADTSNNNTNDNTDNSNDNSESTDSSPTGWRKVDFNDDSRVNLIDFSILIHWFDSGDFPAKIDVNTDENVNLSDFSIMMYYWTG